MKKSLRKLTALLVSVVILFSVFALAACASSIPYIGDNGNWWVNGKDTGTRAQGEDGFSPVITIDEETGHLIVNGVDTGYKVMMGENGKNGEPGETGRTPLIEIGLNGNWFVDGVDTGRKAQGKDGENGKDAVSSITLSMSEDGYLEVNGIKTDIYIKNALELRDAVKNARIENHVLTWDTDLQSETAEFEIAVYTAVSGLKDKIAASDTVIKGTAASLSSNLTALECTSGGRIPEGGYKVVVSYEGAAEEGARIGNKSAEKDWVYLIPKQSAITNAVITDGVLSWTTPLPVGTEFNIAVYQNSAGAIGAKVTDGTAAKTGSATVSVDLSTIYTPAAVGDYFVVVSFDGDTVKDGYIIIDTESDALKWRAAAIKNAAIANDIVSWQTELMAGVVFTVKVAVNDQGVRGQQKASQTTTNTLYSLSGIKGQLSAGNYFVILFCGGVEYEVLNWTVAAVVIRDVRISGNIISWESDLPTGAMFTLEVWNSANTNRVAYAQIAKGTNATGQEAGRTAIDIKTLKDSSGRDLAATTYTLRVVYDSKTVYQVVWVCPT